MYYWSLGSIPLKSCEVLERLTGHKEVYSERWSTLLTYSVLLQCQKWFFFKSHIVSYYNGITGLMWFTLFYLEVGVTDTYFKVINFVPVPHLLLPNAITIKSKWKWLMARVYYSIVDLAFILYPPDPRSSRPLENAIAVTLSGLQSLGIARNLTLLVIQVSSNIRSPERHFSIHTSKVPYRSSSFPSPYFISHKESIIFWDACI